MRSLSDLFRNFVQLGYVTDDIDAAAAYLEGRPVELPDLRDRTTLLSATLIDGATRGETIPAFAAFATSPSPATLRPLLAVGHTSGAGLAYGALTRWSETR